MPTSPSSLARLEPVDLRRIWQHEARHFTSWLAEESNLALLSETLDLSLVLEEQERDVGPFRADLLCKDTGTDNWVLIENQLERTDHTHLGQLITYAAGLQAATIIWISARFTEEHRAALDWLNEITGEDFNFFGIQVELWRIGSSAVAPRFNIVSKPNDWSKRVRSSKGGSALSAKGSLQLEFWTAYKEYLEKASSIRAAKPYPRVWMPHAVGRSGFTICSIASFYDSALETYDSNELRVEMVVNHRDAKAFFRSLERDRRAIDKALGVAVTWHNPPDSRQAKVYVRRAADLQERANWPEYFSWLREHVELFSRVFTPRVKAMQPDFAD